MKAKAVIAALLGLVFMGHATQAVAQQKARMQTAVPSASIYFELLKRYADRVDKMSNGRIKMEVLPDGAIVPAFEILDAVDKGIVEGGYAWTHYWSGKHPAAGIFSNPMAGSGVGLDQLRTSLGSDRRRRQQALPSGSTPKSSRSTCEPLMIQPMGPDPLGWFKRPIKDVADFKNMKYRAPPGITGEIFKEMGVAAVALPGGEIVPAAQRGTIDAAEWIGPADDLNLGLHTVWKNYYLQGLHQSTDIGEVLINKTWWNKLSPDLQEILRGAAMASMMETYYLQRLAATPRPSSSCARSHGSTSTTRPRSSSPSSFARPTWCSIATRRRTPSSRRCSTPSALLPRPSCPTGPRSSTSIPSSAIPRSRNSTPAGRQIIMVCPPAFHTPKPRTST